MNVSFERARAIMLEHCGIAAPESISLNQALGRVLAENLSAINDVPPFARSPYDGYAFRAVDSQGASRDRPVVLRVLETIAAGFSPQCEILPGTAAKIMTGAPIPEGADTVVMYETTEFDDESVTIFSSSTPGSDIVPAGEDVKAGTLIARRGDRIDPALAGSLASQGLVELPVFKKPRPGIISTGNEVVEADQPISGGAIRNSNRHTLEAACTLLGTEPLYLGRAGDRAEDIAALMAKGLENCDILFTSGGVSVGDYDFTPAALELLGAETLVRGVRIKPGGACAYGLKEGKLIFGLSGNPSSAMVNFYAVALPCLRKLCGCNRLIPEKIKVCLTDGFNKASRNTRIITGKLDLADGTVRMKVPPIQGNAILRGLIGCDVMAVIPPESPPIKPGTFLDAYLLNS